MVVFEHRRGKGGTSLWTVHHSALDTIHGEFLQRFTQVLLVWVPPP
jgi:hypothetical protein